MVSTRAFLFVVLWGVASCSQAAVYQLVPGPTSWITDIEGTVAPSGWGLGGGTITTDGSVGQFDQLLLFSNATSFSSPIVDFSLLLDTPGDDGDQQERISSATRFSEAAVFVTFSGRAPVADTTLPRSVLEITETEIFLTLGGVTSATLGQGFLWELEFLHRDRRQGINERRIAFFSPTVDTMNGFEPGAISLRDRGENPGNAWSLSDGGIGVTRTLIAVREVIIPEPTSILLTVAVLLSLTSGDRRTSS